jgi:hypothetical protein
LWNFFIYSNNYFWVEDGFGRLACIGSKGN